ncbi:flagellar biosynthesis regulator FlbT [Streptacidiphilus sp. MAP12-16]|uniref:hypothetical protein n=1 Tax=Streptacidiphilus sp. MAP12-16 TaxID=3156300 RepID=UPI0035199948
MKDDDVISAWTQRLLTQAPVLSPEQARDFVRDLYFAAQRALHEAESEAAFDREE